MLGKLLLISLACGVVACGAIAGAMRLAVAQDSAGTPRSWSVFLVAGDTAAPVFDNAVARFRSLLHGHTIASIHSFSADDSRVAAGDVATVDNITAALAQLPRRPDAGCLVFITSHGGRDGVVLKADLDYEQRLSPVRLGDMLDNSCGTRPTVAIISACYSGIFLDDAAPNRIILTAARSDRTSFGCGADFDYTYYDSCLLDAWPHAANFHLLYETIVRCVREKERKLGVTPSEPQASFGDEVSNLPIPR